MSESMISKKVIVRGNIAGVHAGVVVGYNPAVQEITLSGAYRLWKVYTRDKTGSISDVAANGLKPKAEHQIGARLKTTTIVNPNGLEISEMEDAAYQSVVDWKN